MSCLKKSAIVFLLLFCIAPAIYAKAPIGKIMYVSSEDVEVKQNPKAFAKVTGSLIYGAQVRILDAEGKWLQIQSETTSVMGWIPATAVTSKRIKNSTVSSNASAKELALAGKGFTQEIENSYKEGNSTVNYEAVDVMEAYPQNNAALESFIKDGKLIAGE